MVKKASKKTELKKKVKKLGEAGPHKSFKRTYREDYIRETNVPGIMYHVMTSFQTVFKNWRLFLPLLLVAVAICVVFIGFSETFSNVETFFSVIVFLILWLTTIFLLRHLMAGHEVKLRDGLYNAMTPLISTFIVFVVALVQCIPIFLLIIAYSAAVQTEFLSTPFYALVFFVFALLMIAISGYLLSSSLIALVAVSAPGMYPFHALRVSSELMMGRRVKFILRLVALVITLAIIWVVIMGPLILFNSWLQQFEWMTSVPFIQVCLAIMTCFSTIYITVYLYSYYRWLLKS